MPVSVKKGEMNNRPSNSNSVAASMEGLGSSTSAVRNKRLEWLSRKRTGPVINFFIILAAVSLTTIAVLTAIPVIKKTISSNKIQASLASTHHNFVKNNTFGNL